MNQAAKVEELKMNARVQLQPLDESLLDTFVRLTTIPQVNQFLPFAPNYSRAEAESLLATVRNQQSGCFCWIIRTQDTLEEIGVLTAMPAFHHQCIQIGYWIDPQYQRMGYATQAVELIVKLAFQHLGKQRVQAQVVPGNEASVRVLEKAGFKKEGRLAKSHIIKGELADTFLYAVTQGEQ